MSLTPLGPWGNSSGCNVGFELALQIGEGRHHVPMFREKQASAHLQPLHLVEESLGLRHYLSVLVRR